MAEFDLRVISLGAGVQSSGLMMMHEAGLFEEKASHAIFADTKVEPSWVYDQLGYLEANVSIPILRPSKGNLGADLRNGLNSTGQKFAAIPFWVAGEDGKETLGRRQCTQEYKLSVVQNAIRDLLSLKPGQRAKGKFRVEVWVGISIDEAHRVKPSRTPWITNHYPLIDLRMRRGDVLHWMKEHGHPEPRASSCVMCPFRRPTEYARWREEKPELFKEACDWDDLIRTTGTGKPQYVSRLLTPLRELPSRAELEKRNDAQLDLFGNECEGMCGV